MDAAKYFRSLCGVRLILLIPSLVALLRSCAPKVQMQVRSGGSFRHDAVLKVNSLINQTALSAAHLRIRNVIAASRLRGDMVVSAKISASVTDLSKSPVMRIDS